MSHKLQTQYTLIGLNNPISGPIYTQESQQENRQEVS